MATRTTSDIYSFPPKLWFGPHLLDNVSRVLSSIDFFGAFWNTLFVASACTLLVLFFDSLAGFTFAKFHFPGKMAVCAAAGYHDGARPAVPGTLLCHYGRVRMGRNL